MQPHSFWTRPVRVTEDRFSAVDYAVA